MSCLQQFSNHRDDVINLSIREYGLTDEWYTKRGNDHFFILDDGIGNLPDSAAPYSFA
ncbi:MAG: hypothetical protein AB2L24_31875 [Mangrovibacterium sp.]